MRIKCILVGLILLVTTMLFAVTNIPEVKAVNDFEIEFVCIDEDEVIIYDTYVDVYDMEDNLLETFNSDYEGTITVDTGELEDFEDGDVLIMRFKDDLDEFFSEYKNWEVFSSWSSMAARTQICMAYKDYQISGAAATNSYKTRDHHWTGKHNENFISYVDMSRMDAFDETTIYYPNIQEGTPYIRIVSNAAGHFSKEYMQTGVHYQWKIYWEIEILNPQGGYVDSAPHQKEFDADNTNGNAESIQYDPDIYIYLYPLKAPTNPNNCYTLNMKLDCDMRKNINNQGWSVWEDIPIDDISWTFYIMMGT